MNLNNTRLARNTVAFFNRPTRVGTENLIPLMRLLSSHNDMNLVFTGPVQTASRMRTGKEQRIEVNWVSKLDPDTLYVAHGNWMNFTRLGRRKPIYLSLVRDPIERMVQTFYARRTYDKLALSRSIYAGYPQQSIAWYKQTFNECVRSGSPECRYTQYAIDDPVDDFRRQSLFFCGNYEDCL